MFGLKQHFYISETFESIQGEGNYAGAHSLFIRFQYCNLRCSWCDSKYTWGKDDAIQKRTREDILQIIQTSTSPNVIFTGGEPCIYPLDKLSVPNKKMHVETNGSIIPTEAFAITLPDGSTLQREAMDEAIIKKFNWVVSPKLGNSGEKLYEKAIRYWASKDWCVFKFIIQNILDIEEVNSTIQQYNIPKEKVYIGLEGNTLDSQLNKELVDDIITNGYNFSPRLHVLLWGTERKK